jgi:hypothetical protein
MEREDKKSLRRPPGRKPATDPAKYHYHFRMTEDENGKFQELFLRSGLKERTKFIKAMIFGREIKVITFDRNAHDFFLRLTNFYAQIQRIGNNYNQTVRAIKTNFGEKRGLAMLYKLEQETREVAEVSRRVLNLTLEYEKIWLPK